MFSFPLACVACADHEFFRLFLLSCSPLVYARRVLEIPPRLTTQAKLAIN